MEIWKENHFSHGESLLLIFSRNINTCCQVITEVTKIMCNTIGLQFFVILIIFQYLVTSDRSSLGKNVFLPCLYNMSSLTFLFQNGV
jgi:hypothetical protein